MRTYGDVELELKKALEKIQELETQLRHGSGAFGSKQRLSQDVVRGGILMPEMLEKGRGKAWS